MHAEYSIMQKITNKGDKRQAAKHKVCKYAIGMFYKDGTRNVKMDDISGQLKISKRTIYELFKDKEQLLLECMKYKVETEQNELYDFVHNHATNVIEVLIKTYQIRLEVMKKITPAFFEDLERYPNVRKYLKQQAKLEHKRSIQFFNQGIEDGYFRESINYEIITRMSDAYMDYILKNRLYDTFTMKELFFNFVSVIVRGYCTEKGLEVLGKFYDEYK